MVLPKAIVATGGFPSQGRLMKKGFMEITEQTAWDMVRYSFKCSLELT